MLFYECRPAVTQFQAESQYFSVGALKLLLIASVKKNKVSHGWSCWGLRDHYTHVQICLGTSRPKFKHSLVYLETFNIVLLNFFLTFLEGR